MILVSVWGSDIVFDGQMTVSTLAIFSKSAIVSLWPTDTDVSLQFIQNEAMEVWESWCQQVLGVGDMSFDDLRDYIFTLTGRQPGLLDRLDEQGLANIPANNRKLTIQFL